MCKSTECQVLSEWKPAGYGFPNKPVADMESDSSWTRAGKKRSVLEDWFGGAGSYLERPVVPEKLVQETRTEEAGLPP